MKIRSILIDDEAHNLRTLRTLLTHYCPSIEIVAVCQSAAEGITAIRHTRPDLLFLDVRMPEQSGFDMLRQLGELTFEIIFVSAFDQYAIDAFEFSALDYLLKPIDYTKLIKSVERVSKRMRSQTTQSDVSHFLHALNEHTHTFQKLTFHHNDRVVFVPLEDLLFIEGHTDYCLAVLKDGNRYSSAKRIKLFEDLLSPASHFLRISKSVIVNLQRVKSYTKGDPCFIELENSFSFEVSRRKKSEILRVLKTKVY